MLETVEEALDAIAQRVFGLVDRLLDLPVRLGWNDRVGPAPFEVVADGVTVVSGSPMQREGPNSPETDALSVLELREPNAVIEGIDDL